MKTIIQIITKASDNQVTCEIFKSYYVYSIFFYLFVFVIFEIKNYSHKIFFILISFFPIVNSNCLYFENGIYIQLAILMQIKLGNIRLTAKLIQIKVTTPTIMSNTINIIVFCLLNYAKSPTLFYFFIFKGIDVNTNNVI